MITISPMWAAVIITLLAPAPCRAEDEMYSPNQYLDQDPDAWEDDELYDAYNESAETTMDVLNRTKRYDEESNEIQTLNTNNNLDVKGELSKILFGHNLKAGESHSTVQDYTDIYDYVLNATQYLGEMRNASEEQVLGSFQSWPPIESSIYLKTKKEVQNLSQKSNEEGDNKPPASDTTRYHYDRAREDVELLLGVTSQRSDKFSKDGLLTVEPGVEVLHWSPDDEAFPKTLKDVTSYEDDDNKTGERGQSSSSDAVGHWLPTDAAVTRQSWSPGDDTQTTELDFENEHGKVHRVTFTKPVARKWFPLYVKPGDTTTNQENSERVTFSKDELRKAIQRIIPMREEARDWSPIDDENSTTLKSEQTEQNMETRDDVLMLRTGAVDTDPVPDEPSPPTTTTSAPPPLATTTETTATILTITTAPAMTGTATETATISTNETTTTTTTTPTTTTTTTPTTTSTTTSTTTNLETTIMPETATLETTTMPETTTVDTSTTPETATLETTTPPETTATTIPTPTTLETTTTPETTPTSITTKPITTTTTRTTRRTTRRTRGKADSSLKIDINAIIAIIANLTYDYEWNLTEEFNRTLIEHGVPICPTVAEETTSSTTLTTPGPYDFSNSTVIGKCFVCGLKDIEIPRNAHCSDAFAGDLIPLVPVDPRARAKIATFRKYCRYLDVQNYIENPSEPRAIYGRFTGGCGVRWTDIASIYTQRTCRARFRPLMGKHFASKRMAKLELALINVENGCIISPMATLLPLSRGISLYARFHACVCTGNWCNRAVRAHSALYTTLLLYSIWLLIS